MRSLQQIDSVLHEDVETQPVERAAKDLLALGEEVLMHWLEAKGYIPTGEMREGFRVLALHRQGAKGDPSFNACRETCRELAYHYNLLIMDPANAASAHRLTMMRMLAKHLFYFVGGKLEDEQLGEFCCASRPLRAAE